MRGYRATHLVGAERQALKAFDSAWADYKSDAADGLKLASAGRDAEAGDLYFAEIAGHYANVERSLKDLIAANDTDAAALDRRHPTTTNRSSPHADDRHAAARGARGSAPGVALARRRAASCRGVGADAARRRAASRDGDLDQHLDVRSRDEIGDDRPRRSRG